MDIKNHKRIESAARVLGYQNNILAVYRRATADQISEGKQWYPETKKLIETIAHTHDLYAYLIDHRALFQAFSALSPRISFNENVEGFEKFAKAARYSASIAPVVAGVESNRRKAYAYISGRSTMWIDLKTAPKTARFALNLEGDLSYVTLDVWAARVVGFTKHDIRGNDYLEIERAYQAVAKIVGFEPAELQAITWIVLRGSGK